jgi:hypothetical protein
VARPVFQPLEEKRSHTPLKQNAWHCSLWPSLGQIQRRGNWGVCCLAGTQEGHPMSFASWEITRQVRRSGAHLNRLPREPWGIHCCFGSIWGWLCGATEETVGVSSWWCARPSSLKHARQVYPDLHLLHPAKKEFENVFSDCSHFLVCPLDALHEK